MPLAKVFVAHAKNDMSKSAFRRLPYEQQLDLQMYRAVIPRYLLDAKLVKDMGFDKLSIVLFHGADYWQRVLDAYSSSQCISENGVMFYCERRPRDPTPSIEAHIEKTTLKRQGRYNNPYKIPAAIRQAQVTRLEAELATTHPYITRAMLQNAFHRSSSVEAALAKIEPLKDPSIAAVVADYTGTISETALVYAVMHTSDARQAIVDYLARIQTLTDRISAAGGDISPSMIEVYAIDPSSDERTGTEVIRDIDVKDLHRDFSHRCKVYASEMHVPTWAVSKIVDHYPREDRWSLVTNLNELIETGILRIDYLSCALETEAATRLASSVKHKTRRTRRRTRTGTTTALLGR